MNGTRLKRNEPTTYWGFATALLALWMGVPVLFSGCSKVSVDEFRTVTDDDVQERDRTSATASGPLPSSEKTATDVETVENGSARNANDSPVLKDVEAPVNVLTDDPQSATADSETNAAAVKATNEDGPPPTGSDDPALTQAIKLLVPDRTFSIEGDSAALRLSFDDLDLEKVLNVTKPPPDIVEHFPDWLAGLDGQPVRIRGFMGPVFQSTDLQAFTLGLNPQCFFGPNRKIYHLIEVAMRDGVFTDYIHQRPFDVEGVFRIRPDVDGDDFWQLYQIEDAIVIDE